MARDWCSVEHAGLSPKVGESCLQGVLPEDGVPMPFGVTLGKHYYVPAPRCLLTANARKPGAGVCNLACAPLARSKTWEEQSAGLADPSLWVCLLSVIALCHCVTVSVETSPLPQTAQSLLRQARLQAEVEAMPPVADPHLTIMGPSY